MKKIFFVLVVLYNYGIADTTSKWNLTIKYDNSLVSYDGFSSLQKCEEFATRKQEKLFSNKMLFKYHCDVVN